MNIPKIRVGIGRDSHRFLPEDSAKPCIIAGILFENCPGLAADSDGDVVFHAICNAISSLTGIPIFGGIIVDLCRKDGITDSQVYLEKAMETLGNQVVQHIALTIEGKRPKFFPHFDIMRANIAKIMKLQTSQVGITATSGDGLTDFACGDGLQCFCVVTTAE